MQLELPYGPERSARSLQQANSALLVGGRHMRLWFARHPRARRYVLRLRPDGAARVTIPRGGSIRQATIFAQEQAGWLERQLLRQAGSQQRRGSWRLGAQIMVRGEFVVLEGATVENQDYVVFGGERVAVTDLSAELRPRVEWHLWQVANQELPERVAQLAAMHGLLPGRVAVRNQRSRWGSCSRHGTISLNWRLIQTPPFVRDYIILHEFAHLKEMNHSRRYWREVARLCPDFAKAEKWLKQHSKLLL
jgi:predicted metal-dependent hydrolase